MSDTLRPYSVYPPLPYLDTPSGSSTVISSRRRRNKDNQDLQPHLTPAPSPPPIVYVCVQAVCVSVSLPCYALMNSLNLYDVRCSGVAGASRWERTAAEQRWARGGTRHSRHQARHPNSGVTRHRWLAQWPMHEVLVRQPCMSCQTRTQKGTYAHGRPGMRGKHECTTPGRGVF